MAQIKGYREALRELGAIDKNLQRQAKQDATRILAPGINAIKTAYPAAAPLSGLNRRWKSGSRNVTPWKIGGIQRSIKSKVTMRKRARTSLAIVVNSPIAQIVEFAGRRNSSKFATALDAAEGRPGRIAWPAFERQKNSIQNAVMASVAEMSRDINRRLAK